MSADEPAERLTLIDDQGREREFVLHDAFDADDVEYYLVEAVDDPETVLVLKRTDAGLEAVEGQELSRIIGLLESED